MLTNEAIPFDLSRIESIRISGAGVEDRAKTLVARRTFKQEAQVAAYIRAIECMDLTTLKGDDTRGRVERLCAKARDPVRRDIFSELGIGDLQLNTAAVCVYHDQVATALKALRGCGVSVVAVSAGFPAGKISFESKLHEIEASIQAGADEIDIVINRAFVLEGKWCALYDELVMMREASSRRARLKTIIGCGDLGTLENIAKATACAIMAGTDFVKTSTGTESVNATLSYGLVMARQIRRFWQEQGIFAGFKAAGGIREAKNAMQWLILMKEELSDVDARWLSKGGFRIGASATQPGLLADIEIQLEHLAFGNYSASHYHPIG